MQKYCIYYIYAKYAKMYIYTKRGANVASSPAANPIITHDQIIVDLSNIVILLMCV